MMVVTMLGDGDCFFHALGYPGGYDGGALRIELADFMEQGAADQDDAASWIEEAGKLRANIWGGHTAIAAYARMKQRAVMLHCRSPAQGTVHVVKVAHEEVPPPCSTSCTTAWAATTARWKLRPPPLPTWRPLGSSRRLLNTWPRRSSTTRPWPWPGRSAPASAFRRPGQPPSAPRRQGQRQRQPQRRRQQSEPVRSHQRGRLPTKPAPARRSQKLPAKSRR